MSNISSAYDAFKVRVQAVLPNHTELSNPYAPEENSEHVLRQAYGLRFGAAENTNRNMSCMLSVGRIIECVIARKFYAAEFNRSAKEAIEKQLLEDQFLLIKDVEKTPTLSSASVAKCDYVGDNGIEFVFNEDKPFMMIVSNFRVEYFENLN